jgi:tRNA (guanosine-2'-O-)-methyltransferase
LIRSAAFAAFVARPALVALPALAAVAAFGCGGASGSAPQPGAPAGPAVTVTGVAPSGDVALAAGCTPTGPELCFNAIDDNCNGAIDEGCGELTGPLQLTIAWGASPADVNLTLVTPEGKVSDPHAAPTARGRCALDRDCPKGETCRGQNLENIHCDAPVAGHYEAEVVLAALGDATEPVDVHFAARLGARSVAFEAQLTRASSRRGLSFDVRP